MPLVSVIIPTYNRANIVTEAIDSVIQQTFRDFEIIVVDDGSKDNTRKKLIRKYGNKIRYIYLEHKGIPRRNAGIKASKGKYIAFLDDDDLWLPEKLTRQIDLMNKLSAEVGLVYCSAYVQKRNDLKINEAELRGNIIKNILLENVITSLSGVIIKRECFNKVGLFDESLQLSEDRDLWIRISRYYNVDFVQEPLIITRRLGMHRHVVIDENSSAYYFVLDKVFNDPNCPDYIKKFKKKAYAFRFLELMGPYFSRNKVLKVWRCFFNALFKDPMTIKLKHLKLFLKAPIRPFFR